MKTNCENGAKKCSKTLLPQLLVNGSNITKLSCYLGSSSWLLMKIFIGKHRGKMENFTVSYESNIFTWIFIKLGFVIRGTFIH